MQAELTKLMRGMGTSLRDLLPVVGIVLLFQFAVAGAPMGAAGGWLAGLGLIALGLTLLMRGISLVLLPLGERAAFDLAARGNLALLLIFAFALGFGSTAAEPALFAVAAEAAKAAAGDGLIGGAAAERTLFAALLRYTVSAGVGLGLALGVLRIAMGWPVMPFILGGYGLAAVLALAGNSPLRNFAFDAGTAATSVINIPIIMALGLGLATVIRGRTPLADGFGLVAMASLMPMLVMLTGGMLL